MRTLAAQLFTSLTPDWGAAIQSYAPASLALSNARSSEPFIGRRYMNNGSLPHPVLPTMVQTPLRYPARTTDFRNICPIGRVYFGLIFLGNAVIHQNGNGHPFFRCEPLQRGSKVQGRNAIESNTHMLLCQFAPDQSRRAAIFLCR
jgi:hypothetical protein